MLKSKNERKDRQRKEKGKENLFSSMHLDKMKSFVRIQQERKGNGKLHA